ncbi:hypothetical protein [Candidatus Binatus sp.]
MLTRILIFCAVLGGLVSIGVRAARAQSSLEVPGPSNQYQPYIPPQQATPPVIRLAPSDGDSGNTIQLLPGWNQPAQPQAAATPPPAPPAHLNVAPMTAQAAPALPAVFRGCWQGQVSELDWIRSEPGAHKIGFWTPKTYRLCYEQIGNQPFQLTFTETGVEANDKIINPRGRVVPISTDGRAYATMRSQLDFNEYKTHNDGFSFSPTFAVDEITNLDCRIAGNDMLVSADVFGSRDGDPWFRAHWRADFHRFEN